MAQDHLTIELDVFEGRYAGLLLAEVEFTSEEEAMAFQAPGVVWEGCYVYKGVIKIAG